MLSRREWEIAEDRDHPLVLRYIPPRDWLKPLGLPIVSPRHEEAHAQVAAIALDMMHDQQPRISYSRNRNHYTLRGTRYDERPELYTYDIIPPAVDAMAAAGFLENIIAPNNPHCGWQSRFCATPALAEALGNAPPPVAKPRPRALIRLRDKSKLLVDFRDTERTSRMARNVAKITEAIGGLTIGLPKIGERRGDLLLIGDCCVNLGNTNFYRVFNEDWRHGGRFYGHFVQGLPGKIRRQLMIDGEPVAEPDYPAHHLRILYALEGLPLFGDPYELEGWAREIVKLAVLILINAGTWRSARGAVMHKCGLNQVEAACLIREIKLRHASIERHFHSGAGTWLQRIDSDMAERVELGLLRQGVVALPIHDSFVLPARYESAALEAMDAAFHHVVSRVPARHE
jgi:hypothetical protein